MALTSRMILGFAAASKDSNLMLNMVFSFGFSCAQSKKCFNATVNGTNLYRCLLRGGSRSCCWRCRRHSNLLDVKLRLQTDIRKST